MTRTEKDKPARPPRVRVSAVRIPRGFARVPVEHLRLMLVFAARYAVQRGMTSAALTVEELLAEHGAALADEDLRGLVRDIDAEDVIAAAGRVEWDGATWRRVKAWAEKVLAERQRMPVAAGTSMPRESGR